MAGHWAGAVLPVYWFAAAAGLGSSRRQADRRRRDSGRPATGAVRARLRVRPGVVLAAASGVQLLPGRRRERHRLALLDRAGGEPGEAVALVPPRVESTPRGGSCRTWRTDRRCTSSPRPSIRRRCGRTCGDRPVPLRSDGFADPPRARCDGPGHGADPPTALQRPGLGRERAAADPRPANAAPSDRRRDVRGCPATFASTTSSSGPARVR